MFPVKSIGSPAICKSYKSLHCVSNIYFSDHDSYLNKKNSDSETISFSEFQTRNVSLLGNQIESVYEHTTSNGNEKFTIEKFSRIQPEEKQWLIQFNFVDINEFASSIVIPIYIENLIDIKKEGAPFTSTQALKLTFGMFNQSGEKVITEESLKI